MLRDPAPTLDINSCLEEEPLINATPKSNEPRVEMEGVGVGLGLGLGLDPESLLLPPPPPQPASHITAKMIADLNRRPLLITTLPFWGVNLKIISTKLPI
jgi:hypothetical protein